MLNQACIQIYSIWIYLNKCYLFVIYALVEGVFVFYLFKVNRNTIWIHSRQTRDDGRGKRDSHTAQSYTLTPWRSCRRPTWSYVAITASIAANWSLLKLAKGGSGGVDFGVRHRIGIHLGGQLEIWIHLNVFKKYLFNLQRVFLYSIYSKSIWILFEYIHGRRGTMAEAKGIATRHRATRWPPEEVVDVQHGHM